MTFRACSSPAPTLVRPQPARAILSQKSVHTTLSITHHTRKRPSTGPRTTHGPQSLPWSVHWQHPHKVTREKRKSKETNKKKLQQVIQSQTKAKSKITWRRQVSDPLCKGNGSTHPRQNKAQKPTKCSPWTNATPPGRMHANHHLKIGQLQQFSSHRSDRSTPPVTDRCSTCAQDQHSDRWPRPVWPVHTRAQKWLETT
jgi:hypothetical protein